MLLGGRRHDVRVVLVVVGWELLLLCGVRQGVVVLSWLCIAREKIDGLDDRSGKKVFRNLLAMRSWCHGLTEVCRWVEDWMEIG